MQVTCGAPSLAEVADAVRLRARAEWVEWDLSARFVDAGEARVRQSDSPALMKAVELSFVSTDLAQGLHWSEGQVSYRVAQARRVRDHTPLVWEAFRHGRIDGAKAREISGAIDQLARPESQERLDRTVVAYAETHTTAELRRWLKVFVARVEADLCRERADTERADRQVQVEHGDHGMSTMLITHTSLVMAAVERRLAREATAFGTDDPRTMDQRRADLFAAWMTTNDAHAPAVSASIAVTMPGSAIAGASDQPAVAADGSWLVPSQWILDLAEHAGNNLFWHRMILDPVSDDVLAHEYAGRFASDVLAQALEFRDGVCQAPGCCTPAHACDIDHRIPHDDRGPTAAWNLGPYCRKHHKAKGFGLIDTGPTTTSPPGRSRNRPLHRVDTPDVVRPERAIHSLLQQHAG